MSNNVPELLYVGGYWVPGCLNSKKQRPKRRFGGEGKGAREMERIPMDN